MEKLKRNWRKTVSVVDKCQTFLPAAMATLFQHFPRIFLTLPPHLLFLSFPLTMYATHVPARKCDQQQVLSFFSLLFAVLLLSLLLLFLSFIRVMNSRGAECQLYVNKELSLWHVWCVPNGWQFLHSPGQKTESL